MRCKKCGGDLELKDAFCPYCGTPVENVMKHRETMEKYEQEFRQTQTEVFQETEKVKRLSGRVIMIAVLIVLNIIILFVIMNSYKIVSAFQKMEISRNVDTHKAELDKMLEEGEYFLASEYFQQNSLYYGDSMQGYDCVIDTAGYYEQVEMKLSTMLYYRLNGRDEDYIIDEYEHVAMMLEGYFSASQSPYFYSEERLMDGHQIYIDDMVEQMKLMMKTYCYITDEDWDSFALMSESGIAQYLKERGKAHESEEPLGV